MLTRIVRWVHRKFRLDLLIFLLMIIFRLLVLLSKYFSLILNEFLFSVQASSDSQYKDRRSCSPELNDSSLELRQGTGGYGGITNHPITKRQSDSGALESNNSEIKFQQSLFTRSTSLPYCASEAENEMYSPFGYYYGDEVCVDKKFNFFSNNIFKIRSLLTKKKKITERRRRPGEKKRRGNQNRQTEATQGSEHRASQFGGQLRCRYRCQSRGPRAIFGTGI